MTKRITRESICEYHDRISERFKELGSGAFASVYQHPRKDVVVKVFDAKDDNGYSKYLKWCLKNKKNPYAPKIYGVERFKNKDKNEEITIVFLEKLHSARQSDLTDLVNKHSTPSRWCSEDDVERWQEIANTSKDKHLRALAKFLVKEADDLDLHSENFMWRPGTKQLVFTDPLA